MDLNGDFLGSRAKSYQAFQSLTLPQLNGNGILTPFMPKLEETLVQSKRPRNGPKSLVSVSSWSLKKKSLSSLALENIKNVKFSQILRLFFSIFLVNFHFSVSRNGPHSGLGLVSVSRYYLYLGIGLVLVSLILVSSNSDLCRSFLSISLVFPLWSFTGSNDDT